MGKKGGTSWLTVVKRAFRSPTKDHDKKSSRRREEMEQEEEEKKREKRRWLLRRPTSNTQQCQEKDPENSAQATVNPSLGLEQRHEIIAVGAATTAAAEATVRKAHAAVEIIRLTRPSGSVREHYAAIVLQTAFRGYLARRALRALKGIVKLQALVRGQNVRKQATMTLKCMQALLRVQARVRDQRARLSQEGSRKSMFAETNNIWDSRFLRGVHERKSIHSRAGSCLADDWDEYPCTLEQLDAILQSRNEASLKRETTLSQSFSQQIWDSLRIPSSGDETEQDERLNWLDHWMATKQWESSNRTSTDRREAVKVLEIDTPRPHCYSSPSFRRTQSQIQHQKQSSARCPASPHRRESCTQFPITPSPSRMKPLRVRSASPRCSGEERSYSLANTPSMSSARCGFRRGSGSEGVLPNYMAATESAKARVRPQSEPRQRPSTPERERGVSAKKRLSYPVAEPCYVSAGIGRSSFTQSLSSPSFKSVQAGFMVMGQPSNLSSCYTESIGGEISPCSTTDLRRWFK